MKTVKVIHFTKNGDNIFTEIWKLKKELSGNFKKDKTRLKILVNKSAHKPHNTFATRFYCVIWENDNSSYSFLMENK